MNWIIGKPESHRIWAYSELIDSAWTSSFYENKAASGVHDELRHSLALWEDIFIGVCDQKVEL